MPPKMDNGFPACCLPGMGALAGQESPQVIT
jgi:hypothetical protein